MSGEILGLADGGKSLATSAGEFRDLGQLRSKSSTKRSSLEIDTGESFKSPSVIEWDNKLVSCGGRSLDSILYCLPSPNSITPPRKSSSSPSIYVILLESVLPKKTKTNLVPMVNIWIQMKATKSVSFLSSKLLGSCVQNSFRIVSFAWLSCSRIYYRKSEKYIDGSELRNLPPATSAAVGKSLVWVSDRVGATFVVLTFRHTGFELAESLCAKLGRETAVRG